MALIEPSPVNSGRPARVPPGTRRDRPRPVVWLRGDYDVATAADLSATLDRAIAADHADVVVDMSEVTFMSADIVGLLVRVRHDLALRSRSLHLRSPSRSAVHTLDCCDLASLLEAAAFPSCTGRPGHTRVIIPRRLLGTVAFVLDQPPTNGAVRRRP